MDDASLIFVERGVEVCFLGREKIVLDYKVEEEMEKYICETRNFIYHRVTRRNGKAWFDRDFTKVPTSIEHKLEKIMNDILKD